MTPIIDILSGPDCGCGCSGGCSGQSSQSDGTTGDIGSLITGGFNIVKGLFGGGSSTPDCTPTAGCFKCKIKGAGGIGVCMDYFWQTIQPSLKDAVTTGQLPIANYLATMRGVQAQLSDGNLFTPQDDAGLNQSKQRMITEIATAENALNAAAAAAQPAASASPMPGTTTAFGLPATILGIPTDEVLILAGGSLVLMSVLRSNN